MLNLYNLTVMSTQKALWLSLIILLTFAVMGWFFLLNQSRTGSKYPFRFGLDLVGGTELIYRADTTKVSDVGDAMASLKEVIERRVNIFGVSEPLVQTERAGLVSGHQEERLIVELPGVSEIDKAIALIGQTPILEFRLARENFQELLEADPKASIDALFLPTQLTGRYLSRAQVEFYSNTQQPKVGLKFNPEGNKLFAQITKEHKGEVLAIILDGNLLSAPVIQEEITSGEAQISGGFTPDQAKALVRNLNYG